MNPPNRKSTSMKAAQVKPATSAIQRKTPVAPPVYNPQQTPRVLQRKAGVSKGTIQQTPARVVQMVWCTKCNRSGHTKSKCYLYKDGSQAKALAVRQQSKEQRAYDHFSGYRSDFFRENDVKVEHVRAFFEAGYSLHGHGSGKRGSGENQATKDDANTFVGWFRGKYLNN